MSDRTVSDEGSRTGGKGTPVPVSAPAAPAFRTNLALFLAGPLIWTAHFVFVYLVTEAGCTGDGPGLNLFDPPVPTVATLAATAVGVVASLLSARWSYRRWRAMREEDGGDQTVLDGSGSGALSFGGFILSMLGCIVILFVGLPALVVPGCMP